MKKLIDENNVLRFTYEQQDSTELTHLLQSLVATPTDQLESEWGRNLLARAVKHLAIIVLQERGLSYDRKD